MEQKDRDTAPNIACQSQAELAMEQQRAQTDGIKAHSELLRAQARAAETPPGTFVNLIASVFVKFAAGMALFALADYFRAMGATP